VGWKFLEGIGEKVAEAAKGDNDKIATALTEKITQFGLDIDDLEIEFSDGVATVSGVAADDATVEKTILIIGNTQGVSEVEADGFVAGTTEAEKAEYAKARAEAIARARELAEGRDKEEAEKKARLELRERRRKAQAAAARQTSKFYEVKSGDTLSKIAQEFYGDGSKFPVIFEANQPMLKSADLIYPGQMLRIPPQG
jgi:nucleoid-associated protein YgaU